MITWRINWGHGAWNWGHGAWNFGTKEHTRQLTLGAAMLTMLITLCAEQMPNERRAKPIGSVVCTGDLKIIEKKESID